MSWIPRRRNKPRPGRLQGAALEQLRRDCFERDGYRCQAIRWFAFRDAGGGLLSELYTKCNRIVTWDGPDAGHMAHLRNKRMFSDSLDQVQTECRFCHNDYHQFGPSRIKPVPKKPDIQEAI